MTLESLLPVGRDCDCGNPMVWHHGQQRCAVYGRHLPPATANGANIMRRRGRYDELLDAVMAAPNDATRARRHRERRDTASTTRGRQTSTMVPPQTSGPGAALTAPDLTPRKSVM